MLIAQNNQRNRVDQLYLFQEVFDSDGIIAVFFVTNHTFYFFQLVDLDSCFHIFEMNILILFNITLSVEFCRIPPKK